MKFEINKKILNQVMKKGDWIRLAVLLAIFFVCWTWVLLSYRGALSPEERVRRIYGAQAADIDKSDNL